MMMGNWCVHAYRNKQKATFGILLTKFQKYTIRRIKSAFQNEKYIEMKMFAQLPEYPWPKANGAAAKQRNNRLDFNFY